MEAPRRPATIAGVQMTFLMAEEVKAMATTQIRVQSIRDRRQPRTFSPMDLRMGPATAVHRCQTDGNGVLTCWGHMGAVPVPFPIYSPIAHKYDILILKCVCYACSKPLVPPDNPRAEQLPPIGNPNRVFKMGELAARRRKTGIACPHCGTPQPPYDRKNIEIEAAWDSEKKAGTELKRCLRLATIVTNFFKRHSGGGGEKDGDVGMGVEVDETKMEDDDEARQPPLEDEDFVWLRKQRWLLPDWTIVEGPNAEPPAMNEDGLLPVSYLPVLLQGLVAFRGFTKVPWSAARTFAVLDNISDEDVVYLGLVGVSHAGVVPAWTGKYMHPRNMIIRIMPVVPPCARPAVVLAEGSRKENTDDLTQAVIMLTKETRKAWAKARSSDVYAAKPKSAHDRSTEWTAFHLDEAEVLAASGADEEDIPLMTPEGFAAFCEVAPTCAVKVQETAAGIIANDNRKTKALVQRNKQILETIKKRLDGKRGRVRQNLVGCRVDFTARSVIYCDPFVAIDEIAIPPSIADAMTKGVRVTDRNRHLLRDMVDAGDFPWGCTTPSDARPELKSARGAQSVLYPDGRLILLKYLNREAREDLTLPLNAVVNRWMCDDDVVLFNRQPSLHKYSIMALKAKIRGRYAIGFNPIITGPFNADYDGDEMNLHLLQDLEADAEAWELMSVTKQVVSVQNSNPTFSLVQDPLTQAWRICHKDVFFDRSTFMQLVSQVQHVHHIRMPEPAIMTFVPDPYSPTGRRKKVLYTGKQVWSVLISPRININLPVSKSADDLLVVDSAEELVLIRNGELLAGVLGAGQIKAARNSLPHLTAIYEGKEAASKFLFNTQRVLVQALNRDGFTASVSHMRPPNSAHAVVHSLLMTALTKLREVLRMPGMELQPKADLEMQITKFNMYLMMCVSKTLLRVMGADGTENCIKSMIKAKSKGSPMNLMQMGGCLGQQTVENGRIMGGTFLRCTRSSPSCMWGDFGAWASGFVSECFLSGLSPTAMFQHDMAGRESIVNSSCYTARTGYSERQMVNFLNMAITNIFGAIMYGAVMLALLYGGDGFDRSCLHPVFVQPILMSDDALAAGMAGTHPRYLAMLHTCRRFYRHGGPGTWVSGRLEVKPCLPFSTSALVSMHTCEVDRTTPAITESNWVDVVGLPLSGLLADMAKARPMRALLALTMDLVWHLRAAALCGVTHEAAALRASATGKSVSVTKPMTVGQVTALLDSARQKFFMALIAPGENVGVHAAQSIGGPSTQNTLNTFHQAGFSAGVRVVYGFPRMREIQYTSTDSRDQMATPTMFIAVKEGVSEAALEKGARHIITSKLHDLVESSAVLEDPVGPRGGPPHTAIAADRELLSHAALIAGSEADLDPQVEGLVPSRYILRLVLNKPETRFKRLTPAIIASALTKPNLRALPDVVSIIYSHPEDTNWVIRVRLWDGEDDVACRRQLGLLLRNAAIVGMGNIERAVVLPRGEQRIAADGSLETVERKRILTEGTAFMQIAKLPWVDWPNTLTNNIRVAYHTLGIHAALVTIVHELREVICGDGKDIVGINHINLLAMAMCVTGKVRPVTHNGFRHTPAISVLTTVAFEKVTDTLCEAALLGRVDSMNAAAPNIMFGQKIPVGTGCVSVITTDSLSKNIIQPYEAGPLVKDSLRPSGGEGGVLAAFQGSSALSLAPSAVRARATLQDRPIPSLSGLREATETLFHSHSRNKKNKRSWDIEDDDDDDVHIHSRLLTQGPVPLHPIEMLPRKRSRAPQPLSPVGLPPVISDLGSLLSTISSSVIYDPKKKI